MKGLFIFFLIRCFIIWDRNVMKYIYVTLQRHLHYTYT